MQRQLLFLFLVIAGGQVLAQRYTSPRYYFRQFHNEYVKLERRDLRYHEAKIREEDRDKVERYRASMMDQLADSRREVNKMPPYKKEERMLIVGYNEGLDSLELAYQSLAKAVKLEPYQYESPEEMQAYYQAQHKAEKDIRRSFAILDEVEREFAIVHNMGLKKDEEMEKHHQLIQEAHAHLREVSLSYYRIHHGFKNFLDTVKKHTNVNLDTFFLADEAVAISDMAGEEIERAKDFEPGELLKKNLQKDLITYLKSCQREAGKELRKIAQHLEAEPFYTNGHRDARIDLKFFAQRYESLSDSFLRARTGFIEEYFAD